MSKKDEQKGNVLITGANGFIGMHLAKYLIEKGYKVAALPRVYLSEPVAMERYIKEVNPKYIFHLAAYGNQTHQDDLDETIYTNVIKTYSILRASLDVDYEAFINVSSSSVYGYKTVPMAESMSLECKDPYGCTKAAGEYITKAFAFHDKPVVNVRPFSVYGGGEQEHRLIPRIIKCLNDPTDTLKLNPDSVHDWVYVEDFIEGMMVVAENVCRFCGKDVNIGTGRQTSNEMVYEILSEIAGKDATIEIVDGNKNDKKCWKASTSFLKEYGFETKTSLETGLLKTYEYYQKQEPKTLRDAMNTSLDMIGSEGFI